MEEKEEGALRNNAKQVISDFHNYDFSEINSLNITLTKDGQVSVLGRTHKVSANRTILIASKGCVHIVHNQYENQQPGQGMSFTQPIIPTDEMSVSDIVEKFKPVM